MPNYILLKTDGTMHNIDINESVSENSIVNILGGDITIHGQYDLDQMGDDGVVIIGLKSSQIINTHTFMAPFNNHIFYGNILLNRVDKNGCSIDFYVDDYNKFLNSYDYHKIMSS